MAKKKAKKRDHTGRIDPADYGIDLPAIVGEITEHLEGTYKEIGERAGNMPAGSASNVINGHVKPSLGAVAALAHATGGSLVVKYEPPDMKRAKK